MALLVAGGKSFDVDALLFDKDGTLLEFSYTWGVWTRHMQEKFTSILEAKGITPLGRDELGKEWGITFAPDGSPTAYDRGGPLAAGTLAELMSLLTATGYRRGLSWSESRVAAQECLRYTEERMHEERPAMALPGVPELLAACREIGIPAAVVTADETTYAVQHLSWLGLDGYFAEIIGTDQVDHGKPFPDMVELACSRLGIDPSRAAVIGDTNGDMRMARSAGAAAAVGLAEGASTRELPDADTIVPSCAQIELKA
ncbi:HAD family hydrolase [Paenibacillus pasadenensis]|uniref:HAD family hydrolase n=1 Tax=Paenibacillus pasadenensis TaxID=217090 RepID=UPI00203C8CFB|nr:HAD family hydrolase [Paenibacillus pasadenensis]MCM3747799.1 HAD family hydrolase [Paenibacillus pasadenensis]